MGRGAHWSDEDLSILCVLIGPEWSLSSIKKVAQLKRGGGEGKKTNGRLKVDRTELQAFVGANPGCSLGVLSRRYGVFSLALSKTLKGEIGAKPYKALKAIRLKVNHRNTRLAWCRRLLTMFRIRAAEGGRVRGKFTPLDLNQVLWSDEKSFWHCTRLVSQNTRFKYIGTKAEALAAVPSNTTTVEYDKQRRMQDILVHLIVSGATGATQPYFLPQNAKIDSD
eukprot:508314-Amphidinium_carterae.1